MVIYVLNDGRSTVHAVYGGLSVYGYSSNDFLSGEFTLNDIVHQEDLPGIFEKITRETDRGAKNFELEFRAVTKSGQSVWVASTVSPEYDELKKLTRFLMEMKDVTIHKLYAAELKEMWMKAQKNHGIMQSLFKHSKDGIVLMDRYGVIIEWSGGYEEITGISKQEAIGNTIWDVVASLLREEDKIAEEIWTLKHCFESAVSGKYPEVIIRHIIHRTTSEHRIFHVQYFPVPIPEDTIVGALVHDVSEEVRSREKLEQSNLLLESIMHAIPVPVYVKDKNGEYLRCNEAFLEQFDLSKEQCIGKKDDELFPWYSKRIKDLEKKLLSDVNNPNARISNYNSDVEKIIYRSALHHKGKKNGIVGVMIDVSDLKKIEEELSDERVRLQALGDHLPEGCVYRMEIHEKEKKIKLSYASGTWEKVTNTPKDKALSDANVFLSKIHPDDLEIVKSNLWKTLNIQENFIYQLRYFYKPTEKRWLYLSAHRHIVNGQLVSDGIILDITDRKQAEIELEIYRDNLELMVTERTDQLAKANLNLKEANEKLQMFNHELSLYRTQLEKMVSDRTSELLKAKEKAEESDRLKSAFLANMSHEIRTPLNGMVGFINILSSGGLPPERNKEYVQMINSCSRQLTQLIDDIVDIAKIESGQLRITRRLCHINKLMYDMFRIYDSLMYVENQEPLMLILDDSNFVDRCTIYIDPLRLRQVLSNLLGNAIKFTKKGFVRFGYRKLDYATLEFTVEDTGIGIAPDHLETIFKQFRQAELGNEHLYRGTGLGLAIAQSLVKMMGGVISVESTVGIGSVFRFTISCQYDKDDFLDTGYELAQNELPETRYPELNLEN